MSDNATIKGIDASALAGLANVQQSESRAKALSKQEVTSAKEAEKAASGFEALMLHEMLKSMWETVETTGLMGEDSNEAQIYRDMLNQAIADSAAKGPGIGMKKLVLSEINRQHRASK